MVRRVLAGVAVLCFWAAAAHAQPQVKKEPIKPVAASDAPAMFQSYCAPCHGKAAKGDGPAAAALKKAPADLTKISARNGGKFPDVKVKRYIEGLDEVAAHGTRDMPMWGSLFRKGCPYWEQQINCAGSELPIFRWIVAAPASVTSAGSVLGVLVRCMAPPEDGVMTGPRFHLFKGS